VDPIYTVVRQTMLSAAAEEAWRYLVDGALLTSWFADSDDLRPGGPFRFAFGDGDYFSGNVTEWDPPVSLGLEWRFLGVGPPFDIRFSLLPVGEQTELTVQDRGAASAAEAAGLSEGWEDFLMRCEKFVRTGENSRYRWTELFGGTAFVTDAPAVWSRLAEPAIWRGYFPGAETGVRKGAQAVEVSFRDPAWGDVCTQAELRVEARRGRCCLHLAHRGWGDLPFDSQVAERRRYAAGWAEFLRQIEAGIPIPS
jgi:uncharacterized protein YndB with AHSA1/START domain